MKAQSHPILLYALHCGNLYGTERMALATLEGMADYRRYVIAPTSVSHPSLLSESRRLGYQSREFKNVLHFVKVVFPIFLKNRRIDIISTSATQNIIFRWMAIFLMVNIRQLNVVHGGGEDKYSYANKYRLNEQDIQLVAVSDFVAHKLLAHHVRQEKIVVIHNFLSSTELGTRLRRPAFNETIAGSRPLDRSRISVIVVSRLDPVKRLDVLIQAIETKRLDNFVFDIFGTGDLLEPYREIAKHFEGRVNFRGYDADIATRLAAADLFLHLCPDEPFGLVVLEAYAARVPVIVPSSGGTGELVSDGVTGMTYDGADSASLISRLLEAAGLRGDQLDAMADGGLQSLHTRFSSDTGVSAYRNALASVRKA